MSTPPTSAPTEGSGGSPSAAAGPSNGTGHGDGHGDGHGKLAPLVVGAIGIVFGDIGTSPLYALKECVAEPHGLSASDPQTVLGLLSLIFWSITLVVAVKYLTFIMRADNRGEGGILALLALVPDRLQQNPRGGVTWIAVLVLIGAALLYGDGMITPAISVLSAVEGIQVISSTVNIGGTVFELKDYVVPITCVILIGLFAIQSQGTAGIGRFFGPIMVVWFVVIGALGAYHAAQNPVVLKALNPMYAARIFTEHKVHGFLVLGSVVLSVTGGEALYADMGHFGLKAIRVGWMFLAMPALVLNYFGQGAILLTHPEQSSPFFAMVPSGAPAAVLCVLATAATIIASQALISGAFSLTNQAVQLGFFPRVTVKHTSKHAEGQIYIPEINWLLGIVCVLLVLAFRESAKLAAAYGIAVTGTMAITSIIYFTVVRSKWNWSLAKSLPLLILFLAFDLPFLAANALKFFQGGYVPVMVAAGFLLIMLTWKRGRRLLGEYIKRTSPPIAEFVEQLDSHVHSRLPGTGVFMCSLSSGVPPVLMHHTRRLGVLHEKVVLLTILFEHVPHTDPSQRVTIEDLGKGFQRVVARYGFMDAPDVPSLIPHADEAVASTPFRGGSLGPANVTYFLGRESFLATEKGNMGPFAESIFSFLSKNSRTATSYFALPPEQVIEVGYQIDL